ncbi:uncharacterized protein H6S33_007122 [Morchella sextelata]|uniref:uncharacterized protein n=1 Tax=Morchella sextelata TaxID=1174677 RepID=UPI001D055F82|nr:uncharacterized protein H6S33_007122 [Morchella sextelata]KAH0604091.1 hypothetical protein H6S33_007122 [Morchella sextelata]
MFWSPRSIPLREQVKSIVMTLVNDRVRTTKPHGRLTSARHRLAVLQMPLYNSILNNATFFENAAVLPYHFSSDHLCIVCPRTAKIIAGSES